MAVTMFTSAFLLGMSPVVLAQILAFGLLLTLWRGLYRHLSLQVQTLVVGILSFLYGIVIDSLYAVLYHMPWWTYALVNGFSFNLAHALSTACFYPLLYVVFRRLYHEKTLYSFFAVLAALVLVSCGQSTPSTTESSASSSQVAERKTNYHYGQYRP